MAVLLNLFFLQMVECACLHNTCGLNCGKCCPLYNQRSFRIGTGLAANRCEKCEVQFVMNYYRSMGKMCIMF